VSEIDRADVLDLVTNSYAVAAEDALARVADDANGRGIVVLRGLCAIGETDTLDIESHGKILKLALVIVLANGTVAAMVSQEKLKYILAVAAKSFGVGFY
jgi:hypothetical protein